MGVEAKATFEQSVGVHTGGSQGGGVRMRWGDLT